LKIVAFQAKDANTALTRIHAELGPEAVVVSVRRLPPDGIARLWQRHGKIEVTACVPEKAGETESEASASAPDISTSESTPPAENKFVPPTPLETHVPQFSGERWRTISWLESKGLLPAFVEQLEQKVHILHGDEPLATPEKEWAAVTDLIVCHWRQARSEMTGTGRPHVVIGPSGSGKTTALCKWMVASVLVNERTAHVWRLDGETPNTSEILSLHCESLGVPVERFWYGTPPTADLLLVDLPGVEARNADALTALREQLAQLPNPHVHLVLNAACESSILFDQFHAFEQFAPEDIIFTHLDEEWQRVKLWNFVLGTNCPISFLGTGQKIPGEFRRAEPALLFPQKNRR
jgi:flagellar biosynthesis protein FlhF